MSPWQLRQYFRTTGNISFANPHGRIPSPSVGLIFWISPLKYFSSAIVRFVWMDERLSSWQPVHETRSPGMPTIQERMSCTAWPFSSSGCTEIGVFAGISKQALPSLSMSTVPRMRFTSQPLSTRSL